MAATGIFMGECYSTTGGPIVGNQKVIPFATHGCSGRANIRQTPGKSRYRASGFGLEDGNRRPLESWKASYTRTRSRIRSGLRTGYKNARNPASFVGSVSPWRITFSRSVSYPRYGLTPFWAATILLPSAYRRPVLGGPLWRKFQSYLWRCVWWCFRRRRFLPVLATTIAMAAEK